MVTEKVDDERDEGDVFQLGGLTRFEKPWVTITTHCSLTGQGEEQVASIYPAKDHPTPGELRPLVMRITMQGIKFNFINKPC